MLSLFKISRRRPPAFASNLFAAPVFQHESVRTDFLMILGQVEVLKLSHPPRGLARGIGVALRPLPANVYCVGQTEPRVKVFAPNTNDEKKVRG